MQLSRSTNGRFATGNRGGPGNPNAKRTAHIKRVLMDAITDDDVRAIVKSLIEEAKTGNAKAAELILNRLVGKPTAEPLSGDAAPELTAEEESEYLEHRRAEMLRRIQNDRPLSEIEVTEENMPEVKAMLQRRIDRLLEAQDATPA